MTSKLEGKSKGFKVLDMIKGRGQGAPHGYYTRLVPVKITREDGTIQIYWKKPGEVPEVKHDGKLRFLSTQTDGSREEHLAKVGEMHGIAKEDLVALSEGDKVKVTGGPDDSLHGKEGVVNLIYAPGANPAPRLSVKIDGANGKTKSHTLNVNSVEKTGDADKESLKAVSAKTMKVALPGGREIYVTKASYDKYYSDLVNDNSQIQSRYNRMKLMVAPKGLYTEVATGKQYRVKAISPAGPDQVVVLQQMHFSPGAGDKGFGKAKLSVFQTALKTGAIVRMVPAGVADSTKPTTAQLESGFFHASGMIQFDETTGKPVETEETQKLVSDLMGENWELLQRAARSYAVKYPLITKEDCEAVAVEIYEKMSRRFLRYEPFTGNPAGGLEAFVVQNSKVFAENRYKQITVDRQQMVYQMDDGTHAADIMPEDDSPEIASGAFVNASDILSLREGLKAEKSYLRKFFQKHADEKEAARLAEDPRNEPMPLTVSWRAADRVAQLLGFGVFEKQYDNIKEIAEEVSKGLLKTDGTPRFTAVGAEKWVMSARKALYDHLWNEGEAGTEIADLFRSNLKLRSAVRKKRDVQPNDMSSLTDKVKADELTEKRFSGKAGHERIAERLRLNAVDEGMVPRLTGVITGMVNGLLVPNEYAGLVPEAYWGAVDDTLKDLGIELYKTHWDEKGIRKISFLDTVQNKKGMAAKVASRVAAHKTAADESVAAVAAEKEKGK